MKIDFIEISVRNFLSFGNQLTTFRLDQNPFTIITGENGMGKSTLVVEAIHFALFGKTLRKVKKDEIVNNINKKNCEVKVRFTYNDKHEYLIERGIYPDYIVVKNLTLNNEPLDSRSSKKLVQQEIDKLLGFDQTTLKNICVLSINNSKSFVDLTAEETRNVIENLLGIQVFSSMLDETKKNLKASKDILEINKKDILLYKSMLEDFKEKLRRAEIFKENFEKERATKNVDLNKELKEKKDFIEIYRKQIQNIFPGDVLVRPETKKVEPLDTENIDNEIVLLNALIANIASNNIEEEEQNTKYLKQKDKYDSYIKTLEQKNYELRTSISVCQNKIDVGTVDVSKAEKEIEYLKTTEYCPICKSILTEEHRKIEIEKLNNKIIEVSFIFMQNKGIIDNLNHLMAGNLTEIEKYENDKLELQENHKETINHIKEEKQEKINEVNEKLLDKTKQKTEIIDEYRKKKDVIDKENDLVLNEYERKVKVRQDKLDEISLANSRIDNLNLEIKHIEQKIKDLQEDSIEKHVNDLIDINKINEYQLKYDLLLKEKGETINKIRYYEVIKDILSDSGVKANIIKKDIPYLNQSINYYLNSLERNFQVSFNEEFEIKLEGYSKRNLGYHSLSEGEKKRIDLSILLAFIDLTRKKNSVNTNLIIFDEILDTSLDKMGQITLINILKKKIVEGVIKNIFVISHNRNLAIDDATKIEIRNEAGFSKIAEMN